MLGHHPTRTRLNIFFEEKEIFTLIDALKEEECPALTGKIILIEEKRPLPFKLQFSPQFEFLPKPPRKIYTLTLPQESLRQESLQSEGIQRLQYPDMYSPNEYRITLINEKRLRQNSDPYHYLDLLEELKKRYKL